MPQRISPLWGFIIPTNVANNAVLPTPDPPVIRQKLPFSILKFKSLIIVLSYPIDKELTSSL